MLTYPIDSKVDAPIYIYLYKCIKQDIENGILKSGDKLPSKRSFAKNLGLSAITVENAYEQLKVEGYIFSKPKSGFYIADISDIYIPKKDTISPENSEKVKQNFIFSYNKKEKYKLDLSSNEIRPENFPFSIWTRLMRETITNKADELMITSAVGGIFEIRNAISSHLKAFRDMEINPDQIIIGAGSEYLYNLLIQLLGQNKHYALENPGYQKLKKIYNSNHIKYTFIPMDEKGLITDEVIKSGADIIHITPSHSFPSGITTPVSRRYELLDWASKDEQRYIIEDDYDSELRLSGHPLPTLQSMDAKDKVIYLNTFTKTLTSTIRIAYMVLPQSLLNTFYKRLSFYSCTVSNFEQYTLAAFLNNGSYEKHINRMRNYYKKVRDAFISAIEKSDVKSKITVLEKEAGLHFLLKLNCTSSDDVIISQMRNYGINVRLLSEYYNGSFTTDINSTLIINYTSINIDEIPNTMELLEQAIMTL